MVTKMNVYDDNNNNNNNNNKRSRVATTQVGGGGADGDDDDVVPWWTGVPTRLLRKKTLVAAAGAAGGGDSENERLPVHTLTFAMPPTDAAIFRRPGGPARHPSTLRLDHGDVLKMVIPGYKPKSYSISALRCDENELDVTFKVYPHGRASGYLDRLALDDHIYTFGMSKGLRRCCGDDDDDNDNNNNTTITHIGVIAYGVGITEALPVVAAELHRGTRTQVTLLWAARTRADTFWQDEIAVLQRTFPHNFGLQYIFSREIDETALHGRINAKVLQQVFAWQATTTNATTNSTTTVVPRFLSVGTKEMMAYTDQLLAAIGYPMPHYALLLKRKSAIDDQTTTRQHKNQTETTT